MGSRQEAAQESYITQQTLDDAELQAALQLFSHLLDTCVGPHGKIQTIQNSVGGPITMTTSSSRLLSAMSFSRPCLRLIISSVQGHLRNHRDGGLLVGSLCLHLVTNALKVENVGRKCVREVFELLLNVVDEYLNSDDCPVCVSIDTSKVKVMLAYIQSIVGTKPVCGLRLTSASCLSQLILRVFLNTVPDTPKSFLSDRVFTLLFDKSDVKSSEFLEGLLLEWPEKSTLLGEQELQNVKGLSQEVKVAVVSVSMSGDVEEMPCNQAEAERHVIQSALEVVMTKMLAFCNWLHDNQVGLLLCQKVIHPKIKSHLRQNGVLFVERLGLQPMAYIQDLTGASLISTVMALPSESSLGHLSNLTHRILHNKSYLHLQRDGSCVCTLLLCAAFDEQLAELKSVVQSAMSGLYSVLQRPTVLCGGGCWQIHVANDIRRKVMARKHDLCAQLHITESQLQAATKAFVASLEASARSVLSPSFQPWVDTTNWHVWPAPQGVDLTTETTPLSCACGMLTEADIDRKGLQPLLGLENNLSLDCFGEERDGGVEKSPVKTVDSVNPDWLVLDTRECVVSAVRTAVMTATTVLSITQYVHDVN